MELFIKKDPIELGISAGKAAAELIRTTIANNGQANIILATGSSQFETLKQFDHRKRYRLEQSSYVSSG